MPFLNYERMGGVPDGEFRNRKPYPWVNIEGGLTAEGFDQLRGSMPDASLFEKWESVRRAHGQGYHDRYILHYKPGVPLSKPWQDFLAEIKGPGYDAFVRRMLGLPSDKKLVLTLEWYYGWQGCAVSPHCDAMRKLATHIFYFNTEEDWKTEWGGNILIMDDGGKLHRHSGPSFDDLAVAASLDPRGNGSLFFMRTEHSWHGVRPLESPPGPLRKLFIITVNQVNYQVIWRRLRGKDPDGYSIGPYQKPTGPHTS
ncbi:MAG: 2OG-Fe(II) oxygenase [Nitrospiraceae bacterium]|nr:2OG-Fe(II) oxygenase [Nitrospiraceae bacterium]